MTVKGVCIEYAAFQYVGGKNTHTLFSTTFWNGNQHYKIGSFDLHNQPLSCMLDSLGVEVDIGLQPETHLYNITTGQSSMKIGDKVNESPVHSESC